MWIIKIGGSWIDKVELNELITNLSKYSQLENIIIVVGGGCFADAVRLVYASNQMSEKTGHFLALKGTEMFAYIIKEINKRISLINNIESLKVIDRKLKVWMPSIVLKDEPSFINSWEPTSDSVAAWLHTKLKSNGLVFVKSLIFKKKIYKLKHLQDKNVLDKNVGKYLCTQKNIKIVGPEIIDLLRNAKDWKKFYYDLNEVQL